MTTPARPWYVHALIVLLGTLAVLSVAFANGFPLVYSDSGTYLRSAFTGFVPEDRPYWYGLFIKLSSLNGASLWGVVVAQAILCSTLLWRCWRTFGDGRAWTYLLTILVLAPLTGLGWYAGQLVADIFSTIGLLAGLLFLVAPAHNVERASWAVLMVLACWVHLSNLLILPLVLGILILVLSRSDRAVPIRRVATLAIVLFGAWPGLMLANKALTGEAHLSRYSHVFLMGRLAETGILKQWLNEHCADHNHPICVYADSIPTTNKGFMWSDRSPLRWQGGADAVREEYRSIIRATLSEPRYIGLHIAGSLRSTWELLGLWRVADELEGQYYRQEYSAPYGSLASLVPDQLAAYMNSAQNTGPGTLGLRWIDPIYGVLMGLSLIIAALFIAVPKWRGPTLFLILFGLATMIIGSWVCATLSTVDSRFMARTAWMLPWMVALCAWRIQWMRGHR